MLEPQQYIDNAIAAGVPMDAIDSFLAQNPGDYSRIAGAFALPTGSGDTSQTGQTYQFPTVVAPSLPAVGTNDFGGRTDRTFDAQLVSSTPLNAGMTDQYGVAMQDPSLAPVLGTEGVRFVPRWPGRDAADTRCARPRRDHRRQRWRFRGDAADIRGPGTDSASWRNATASPCAARSERRDSDAPSAARSERRDDGEDRGSCRRPRHHGRGIHSALRLPGGGRIAPSHESVEPSRAATVRAPRRGVRVLRQKDDHVHGTDTRSRREASRLQTSQVCVTTTTSASSTSCRAPGSTTTMTNCSTVT